MTKLGAATVCVLGFASMLMIPVAEAGGHSLPPKQQNECSVINGSKGEGKFTGQISGANNSLIEVTSGSETAVVHYNEGGVQVCEGGIAAPTNRLVQGASVTVFGPMKRKGKGFEMTATKIVIAGPPAGTTFGNVSMASQGSVRPINGSVANSAVENGGVRLASNGGATDAWNSGAAGNAPSGGAQGNQNPNGMRIACTALKFTASAERAGTGKGIGRTSVSGITCRMPVDQVGMQLLQDALSDRRMSSVVLSLQNELEASLTNAETSDVTFTEENGTEVVEATFTAQRVEVTHRPSGSKASF